MKYKTILYLLISLTYNVNAQNLVENGAFEDAHPAFNCYYTPTKTSYNILKDYFNDVYELKIIKPLNVCWSADGINNEYSWATPDLFNYDCFNPVTRKTKLTSTMKIKMPLYSENRGNFVGLVGASDNEVGWQPWEEGYIFPLKTPLQAGKLYKLRLKMSYSDSNEWPPTPPNTSNYYDPVPKDKKLEISFSKWQDNWFFDKKNNTLWEDITNEFMIPANSTATWYQKEYYFKAPENVDGKPTSDLKNLIIQAVKTPYERANFPSSAYNSYIWVDDVELIEIDPCNSYCTPAKVKEKLTLGQNPPPNTNRWQDTNGNWWRGSWQVWVNNATDINLWILNRWGEIFYKYDCHDPNGLKNWGGPGFLLEWGGTDESGNQVTNSTQQVNSDNQLFFTASNCEYPKRPNCIYWHNNITWYHIQNPVNIKEVGTIQNNLLDNCCSDHEIIDNYVHPSEIIKVDNYIRSGVNSKVSVPSGTIVKYFAGEEITLGKNFQVENGGEFSMRLEPCEVGGNIKSKPTIRSHVSSVKEEIIYIKSIQSGGANYFVYPSPTIAISNILTDNKEIKYNLIVYDVRGTIVKLFFDVLGDQKIDLTEYAAGIYTCRIDSGSQIIYKRILKK